MSLKKKSEFLGVDFEGFEEVLHQSRNCFRQGQVEYRTVP